MGHFHARERERDCCDTRIIIQSGPEVASFQVERRGRAAACVDGWEEERNEKGKKRDSLVAIKLLFSV